MTTAALLFLTWLPAQQTALTVVDEQGQTHSLSAADLAKVPHRTVKATDQLAEYSGIQLADLLESCGVVLGHDLRGQRLANVVLVEAEDGYRIALAIAEVDPATTDKVILLCDRKNGVPLGENEGPLRLVIPDEKRQARWIRQIRRISVRPVADMPSAPDKSKRP